MTPNRASSHSDDVTAQPAEVVLRTVDPDRGVRYVPCPSVETVLLDDGTLLLLPVRGGQQREVAAPWGRYVHDVVVAGRAVGDCVPSEEIETVNAAIRTLVAHEVLIPESRMVAADVDRFDRQVRWFAQEGINGPRAQRRLAAATVLILGVGGFGTAVAELLARAGVGRLVLTDPDRVEEENLPRQMLYDADVIGSRKSFAAAARLEQIAPDLDVIATEDDLSCSEDVERLVKRYRPSLVVCAADRPPIKIKGWIDDGAFAQGVPVIHGGSRPPLVYVGPMLIPGQTSCFECFHASRTAVGADAFEAEVDERRDASPPSFPGVGWCDVAAACFATSQIVAHLAGVHKPAILGREVEYDARTLEQEWMDPFPDRGIVRCERCAT